MTKDQALALYETKWWETKTPQQIAAFQLFEERLCMPFDLFHEAIEKALGRPVWTHEFGSKGRLKEEFLGQKEPPTMQEIIELIPEAKRILVTT